MPERSCLDCGRSFRPTSPRVRRCPRCQGSGTGWSHNRDTTKQARFRTALLERAGGQCERIEDGARCTRTTDLRATHIVPLAEGGSYHPDNGELLCARHDRESDPHAR